MDDPNDDKDYKSFLTQEDQSPPQHISNFILNYVKQELNPKLKAIYPKLFFIQAFTGAATLLFCPQFSLSFTSNKVLFDIFHSTLGMYGCMAVCGSIFVGSGAIAASLLLKTTEVKKIHRYNFITFSLVSFFSLLVLSFLGETIDLKVTLSWILGAFLGGLLMFELGRSFKGAVGTNLFQ